jgi:hypothetical protein
LKNNYEKPVDKSQLPAYGLERNNFKLLHRSKPQTTEKIRFGNVDTDNSLGVYRYLFAKNYADAPWWGCAVTALVMVIIVLQIERQIILTVGTNWGLAGFRFVIAVIMLL